VRSDTVFSGYLKDPEGTAAAFTDDGWFRTGDVGEIDADGFLKITDRKKDLIITAGGKNIAPQNLENALKASRFISQAIVVGDRRPYVTALITIDHAEVEASGRDPQELVQQIVDDVNRDRVRVEQIKRFAILVPRLHAGGRRGHADAEAPPQGRARAFRKRDRRAVPLTAGFLIASAFLASAVEFVEALTIVLAAGVSRGWRSALAGLGAATLVLAAIVAALGPALTHIPISALRLLVGALLLTFGLQWLRKAILRASGFKALHDEEAIFARELEEARGRAGRETRRARLVRLHARVQGSAA